VWSPTRSCGSTSSRQSTSLRRRAREEYGGRCTYEAAPSKCGRVEAISTSWPNFISSNSRRHDGWFYLRNDDGRLPRFFGQVLMSHKEN
jgi:hypothetical protein